MLLHTGGGIFQTLRNNRIIGAVYDIAVCIQKVVHNPQKICLIRKDNKNFNTHIANITFLTIISICCSTMIQHPSQELLSYFLNPLHRIVQTYNSGMSRLERRETLYPAFRHSFRYRLQA